MKRACALAVSLSMFSAAVQAEPVLPRMFADGMVLQRDQPLPVWGTATPGARLQVGIDGQRVSTTVGKDGAWKVVLPPHAAGGPFQLEITGDGRALQVHDVLFGDVWLASGQSNMEWPLHDTQDAAAVIAAASDAQLRHFKIPKSWSGQPETALAGGHWLPATPANAGSFSAVAYYFARAAAARRGADRHHRQHLGRQHHRSVDACGAPGHRCGHAGHAHAGAA